MKRFDKKYCFLYNEYISSLCVLLCSNYNPKNIMSRTVTLRLNDDIYNLFRSLAESDNRPLSNFIETAACRFIENNEFADEFEMKEINNNALL